VTKKWLYISGIFLGAIILVFLSIHSLPIKSKEDKRYKNVIEAQKNYLVSFNKEITVAKYQLFNHNYSDLEKLIQSNALQKDLINIPLFIKNKELLNSQIKIELSNLEKSEKVFKIFVQQNQELNNSWKYLLIIKKQLSQQETENNDFAELLENLLLYKLTNDDYLATQIQAQIDKLKQYKVQLDNLKDIFWLEQTIKHTEIILEDKPKVEDLFRQLIELSNLKTIKEIEIIYDSEYQKEIQTINVYRLATYIWSLLLLTWIAYLIISNLSKTNRKIIKILENFTEELESKVEQRTAQLVESIEEAERALIKAKEANQAKSRFLANMSHELRTPLNAILGFTQLMSRDRSLNQENKENIKIISRSGEHLLKLINDILEMSKIEAGQTILNESNFDLYALLNSLEEMFRLKAESKNLELLFIRDNQVPQFINADESKLRQILINLLGNGLKFTDKGSVILRVRQGSKPEKNKQNFDITRTNLLEIQQNTFDFFVSNDYCLNFEVEDTGSGISLHEIDKLFTPFEQTELGRKSQEGTGLGLSICQKYVQLMGGEIAVNSILDKGSIFSFNILFKPVSSTQTESSRYKKVISLASDQPNYLILAVDDFPESRLLLVKLLSSVGFQVREASNGQEAIEIWQSWQPHLILMDMRMPVMDGYEATKYIKANLKEQTTVIIALTASAFEEERIVILSAGCDDFMRKPFQEERLFEKIAEHLGVGYLYEEDESLSSVNLETSSQKTISNELTKEDLEVMPQEWLSELYQAASQVDNQQIYSLLEEIPNEYTMLAQSLRNLVHNFRCDKIIDLTESAKK
jgi:signal transduction histidine kinase/DNA-binding response OmpR family regulator